MSHSTFGKDFTAMSKRSEKLREKRIARDAARQALQRGDSISAQRMAASKVAAMALSNFNNKGFFDRDYSMIVGALTDDNTLCIALTDIIGGSAQGQRVGRTVSINTIQLDGMIGVGGDVDQPTYYNNTITEGTSGLVGTPLTLLRIACVTVALVVCSVVPRDCTRGVNSRKCLRWDEVFEPGAAGVRPYATPIRDHAGNSLNFKVLKTWSYMSSIFGDNRTNPRRMKFYKRFREPLRCGFTGSGADVLAGSTNQVFLMAVSNYFGDAGASNQVTKPFIQFSSAVSYDQ